MNTNKMYNELDIKAALGTAEILPEHTAFEYAKFDSERAFKRMQVLRSTKKSLINGVNENNGDLPLELRKKYGKIVVLMEELEHEEVQLIAFGE